MSNKTKEVATAYRMVQYPNHPLAKKSLVPCVRYERNTEFGPEYSEQINPRLTEAQAVALVGTNKPNPRAVIWIKNGFSS